MHRVNLGLIAVAALLAAACSGGKTNLTISARAGAPLGARAGTATAPATPAVTPTEVKLVIRRLELKGVDSSGKEVEAKAGPIPIDLTDLSGTTHQVLGTGIPDGSYTQLEMEIGDIEVIGTDSSGTAFDFKTAIVVEQETCGTFNVTGGNLNFTLNLDVSSWFVDRATGQTLDPTEANRHAIEENIARSFEMFEDNDENGMDDDCECEASGGDSSHDGSSSDSSSTASHDGGGGCSCTSTCAAPMCQPAGGACTSDSDCCGGTGPSPTTSCSMGVCSPL